MTLPWSEAPGASAPSGALNRADTQDAPDDESEVASSAVPASRAGLLSTGELIGGTLEVRALLGEGGMGQVYEAHDRILNRRVAVKVAWEYATAALRSEAQALAALHHPSMVEIYAIGVHRGLEYVVIERIHGTTLEARLERCAAEGRRLTVAEVVDVLVGVAEGLAVVHRAGIAHRDVKPGNVMLAPGNRIVLTDFGIFQPEIERGTRKEVTGSPLYMAPETIRSAVARGEAYLVDIYALGVVAYEVLAGAVPFYDERPLKVLAMHLNAPVPDVAAARPETPPRLAQLVHDMLAKDPRARPQSAEEIAWQLRRLQRDVDAGDDRLSVVIAEDDPFAATILTSIVKEAAPDVEVRVARNGLEALRLVRRRVPDLMVIDLHLPALSGVDLCLRLRDARVFGRCTVLCTSSHADTSELEALRAVGFMRFVPKGDQLLRRLPSLMAEVRAGAARRAVPAAIRHMPRRS